MKKLFLLSVSLIGLGFTACQKDEMPEPPATQTQEATTKASGFSFSTSELFVWGNDGRGSIGLWYNGSMYPPVGFPGEVWLEDVPGYPPITRYANVTIGTRDPSVYVEVRYGQPFGEITCSVLKFRHRDTGQVLSAKIWVSPQGLNT